MEANSFSLNPMSGTVSKSSEDSGVGHAGVSIWVRTTKRLLHGGVGKDAEDFPLRIDIIIGTIKLLDIAKLRFRKERVMRVTSEVLLRFVDLGVCADLQQRVFRIWAMNSAERLGKERRDSSKDLGSVGIAGWAANRTPCTCHGGLGRNRLGCSLP